MAKPIATGCSWMASRCVSGGPDGKCDRYQRTEGWLWAGPGLPQNCRSCMTSSSECVKVVEWVQLVNAQLLSAVHACIYILAGLTPGRSWRFIMKVQLELGCSAKLAHLALAAPLSLSAKVWPAQARPEPAMPTKVVDWSDRTHARRIGDGHYISVEVRCLHVSVLSHHACLHITIIYSMRVQLHFCNRRCTGLQSDLPFKGIKSAHMISMCPFPPTSIFERAPADAWGGV